MLVPSCAVTSAADPDDQIDMAAEHVVHGRAAATIWHMRDLDAGLLAEHRHREMAERADADGGVFHRAGVCLAGRNHVGKGLVRPLGVGGDDVRRGADQEHRHQILLDVQPRLFENRGNHRVRSRRSRETSCRQARSWRPARRRASRPRRTCFPPARSGRAWSADGTAAAAPARRWILRAETAPPA